MLVTRQEFRDQGTNLHRLTECYCTFHLSGEGLAVPPRILATGDAWPEMPFQDIQTSNRPDYCTGPRPSLFFFKRHIVFIVTLGKCLLPEHMLPFYIL
jgi:hypothetical protein